jgi:PAS domain-containing protein
VSADADSSSQVRERLASPAERLFAARYVLAVFAVALGATSALWNVPIGFAIAAILAAGLVAAFVPLRTQGVRRATEEAGEPPPWPDRAIGAILQALPHAAYVLDGAGIVRFANGRAAELFQQRAPVIRST